MKEKLDGGPAFPVSAPGLKMIGMTLRDYFASKAMQGMFASDTENWDCEDFKRRAGACYEMADAMLTEREK